MQNSGCPALKGQKKTRQSTKKKGVRKPKISWICWSLWEQAPKGLPKTWRYLLPCAPKVGYLSQVCRDWGGSWICLPAEAVLTCSHLFDPLMEVFQDRLIPLFHFRALLLTCNHFPMSYQPRKLLLLARVTGIYLASSANAQHSYCLWAAPHFAKTVLYI